jgi:di/tricarboxylate transporter
MSIWIVSAILISAIVLLITEKIPVDLTAIGIIVALMATGTLTPLEAVKGFANPAVITVAAMFLISRAMIRTGAVGFIAQTVIESSKGSPKLAMIIILLIVAISSAFINNTPVVVLLIPIILNLSCEFDLSPSKYLIPVSYASIFGGTCTLIGTSTNIIISDLSALHGFGKLGMFELAVLGVPLTILGIAFLYFAAPYIMPGSAPPTCELGDRPDRRYLAEIKIPPDSPLVGKDADMAFSENYTSLKLFEVIHDFHIHYPDQKNVTISSNDLLMVKGSPTDIVAILHDKVAELPHRAADLNFSAADHDSLIVELIVPPQSALLGERLVETGIRNDPDIHIIAIKRRRIHYTEQKIRNVNLRVGDIILVRCSKKKLDQIRAGTDFIIVEDVHHEIVHKNRAGRTIAIFAGLIIAATMGIADIMVCALTGLFLMILTGCIQLRDAYRALRGDVLMIIVGTIALGAAMEKTGTSQWYAQKFLSLFWGASPNVVLSGFILLTSIGTQLLSNNATAVLLLPIAFSTAASLGVDPKPFIIAVCFGASACFATPIGYQTNLLVYGPGGYRFSDYLKLGLPLNLIVLIMGTIFIPVFWPF